MKIASLIFFVLAPLASWASGASLCKDLFSTEFNIEAKFLYDSDQIIEDKRTPLTFKVKDNGGYFFEAVKNASGELFLSVYLSNPHEGKRSFLRGSDLYQQMMKHFNPKRIKKIHAIWFGHTNREQYYNALAMDMTPSQAAANTWAGRQAAKYGFTKISPIEIFRKNSKNDYITLEFTRP